MKIYVEAKSKADLIRRLAAGEEISGFNYSMFGGGGHYMLDDNLEDGTIIAIYSQMSQGNPVAKSWGTWTNGILKAESFSAEGDEGWLDDETIVWRYYTQWFNGVGEDEFFEHTGAWKPLQALESLSPEMLKLIADEQRESVGSYDWEWRNEPNYVWKQRKEKSAESFSAQETDPYAINGWKTAGVMGLTMIVAGAAYIWSHKKE